MTTLARLSALCAAATLGKHMLNSAIEDCPHIGCDLCTFRAAAEL